MEQTQQEGQVRQAGADAIAARAVALGAESEVIITKCVWDFGQDYRLAHAHRLDLFTDTGSVRLYFPDAELTGADNVARARRTEERLRSAVAQLVARPPAQTYSFR